MSQLSSVLLFTYERLRNLIKAADIISVSKTSEVAIADGLIICGDIESNRLPSWRHNNIQYNESMKITQIEPSDFVAVLALNAASIPHVSRISDAELQWFCSNATFLQVATIDDRFAGFLIGLRPGTDYASPNYRWFCDHYDDFAYVDRVAVSKWARRQGVAESLYDTFARSQSDAAVMTCEVNIRPPNETSMLFHKRMGFRQVGSQVTGGGEKEVAFMEKTL